MVNDRELAKVWDQTIEELASDDDEKWEQHFELALKLSPQDMEACGKIDKVAVAGQQLANWWYTFWDQEDGDEITEANFEANQGQVMMHVLALRTDWELGFYYDAGKRFGKFWNILMGKP